ncbi:MAG: hypothetical protein ABSF92_04910 [Candidatus Acidiferrales bacterium]|jgi:hypothetical protein
MQHRHIQSERAWLSAALACIGVLAAGCGQMGTTSGDQPVLPAQPLSVAVQVCNTTPDGCAAGASYSLATLRDLAINVSWENVPVGTHLQTIEILDPSGWVYQARTQAFAIPEDWDGSAKTTETVPVSGTWIVTRRRAGTWTLRVSLDSQAAVTQTVQIDP